MYVQCVLFVGESTQNACLFSLAMINGIVNTDNGGKKKERQLLTNHMRVHLKY